MMMAFLYILLLAAIAVLLPTIPLQVELLALSLAALTASRTRGASRGRRPPATERALRLHVIVPAHNEEAMVALCVRSLLANEQSPDTAAIPAVDLHVTVIAHNCKDHTAARAAEAGAEALVLDEPVGGKGLALDHGFQHALAAGADAVLVIDSDSIVTPGLTGSVAAAFLNGAAALQTRYEVANPEANQRTRLATLAFRGINVLRPLGRAQLGLSAGIFGNGFGLTAETIRRVPYVANSVVEDLEYHLNLIRAGIRVEFLNDARVLGEMPVGGAAAATQRARWEGGRILMRRRWTGPLAAQVLRGDLRLLEPLLDLLSLPLATQCLLLILGIALAGLPAAASLPFARTVTAYAVLSLMTIGLYVVVSALLGPEPGRTLAALASVPGYLLWKLMLIPRTRLAARKDAAWVRTARNAETPDKPST